MEAFEVDQIIITAIFCLKTFPEMEALRWDNLFQQCDKKR